ncbi:MAG: PglZ domain-containing protein [Chloroflexi bacterium]|nr:PglZ domain-containing protein [Chloroflexota bacterium]
MSDDSIPQSLDEHLYRKLAGLHANARLVFVFDPADRLGLGPEITAGGQVWPVQRYDGNDLSLRVSLVQAGWTAFRPGKRVLIWTTAPRGSDLGSNAHIRLNSLTDLLALADEILDLSLCGVLAELIPNESWPPEALARHEAVFAANLPLVVSGHAELRRHLPRGAVLDIHAVRALALHVSKPDLPVGEFLFHRDSPEQVLRRYIKLAWSADWDAQSHELLRQHARSSPQVTLGNVAAWFEPTPENLAIYLYVRRILGQAQVSNIANQVRGLGILGFDPEPLEPWVETVLTRWEREPAWRRQVIADAEDRLTEGDLQKITAILPIRSPDDLWTVLKQAETPAAIYELARRLLDMTSERELDTVLSAWLVHRPPKLDELPATRHHAAAKAIAGFLDEAAAVVSALNAYAEPPSGLSGILDWYVAGRYYDLEFACARAAGHLRRVPDHGLESRLQRYLDGLRNRVRPLLGDADERLAEQIRANWGKYLNDPRLSTRVLWDLVRQRRLRPTPEARLWIVVFDGMRWDTWQRVVKPRLLELFEVKSPEKAYLSLLPSWTPIARTGLLAGRPPAEWQGPDGRPTRDQALLAARFFEIPAGEREAKLQFYSGMESDRIYRQLDQDHRYPWNVLIFNISDDGLHQERGDLVALNEGIEIKLKGIMLTLNGLVGPEDTVVVSSDHGFVELENDGNGITIQEDDRLSRQAAGQADPVRYRYIVGLDHPAGLTVSHRGLRDSPFTVAIGRRWFRRADSGYRAPDRYAHGGLSLAEMVVPGISLRRIVEKRIELDFIEPSAPAVRVREDESLPLNIVIQNRGNQSAEFALEVKADTDARPQAFRASADPMGQWEGTASIQPIYKARGGSTRLVKITLRYTDAKGKAVVRHRDLSVEITARRDRVEIEFGGLDELDDLSGS